MGGVNGNWLSQLAPAHAPAAIGWWPPAIGWWGVVVLLLVTVLASAYACMRPAARLRRLALRELKQLEEGTLGDGPFASGIEDLLRRYAITVYGRDAVARLSGRAWLEFLTRHGGKEFGSAGDAMLGAAYGSRVGIDRVPLAAGARRFIRRAS